MRTLFRTAIVGLVGVAIAETAFAQMPAKQALDLSADVRWFGSSCHPYTVRWDELRRFMDRSGLIDVFAPDAPQRDELDYHDKILDTKKEYFGQKTFCQTMFDKYRSTGLVRMKSLDEIKRFDDLKPDYGPAPNILKP